MADFVTFRVKQVGPVTVVHPVESEIVQRNLINDLSEELLDYVAREKPPRLLLSLKQVTRYSSEAIGGLVRIARRVKKHEGELKLCINGDFRELFKIAGLDGTLFPIYESESEAVAAFFEHGGDTLE